MANSPTYLFLFLFGLMALQMLLSLVQVRRYQKAIGQMLGSGILGIGQRRGVFSKGELLILSYKPEIDQVVDCRTMKGYTIFATFVSVPAYIGLSLAQIREVGIQLDGQELRYYRKKHPYNPQVLSKKKGALIQAVEAIQIRLKKEEEYRV